MGLRTRRSVGDASRPIPQAPEEFVAQIRRHPLGLVGVGVRLVFIAGILGYMLAMCGVWFGGGFGSFVRVVLVVAGAILIVQMVLRRFFKWANMRTDITDQRIRIRYRVRQPGWDIPMLSITDVTCHSGTIQRLFGIGSLSIQTNFAPMPAVILDVERVDALRLEILELRARAWSAQLGTPPAPSDIASWFNPGPMRAAS